MSKLVQETASTRKRVRGDNEDAQLSVKRATPAAAASKKKVKEAKPTNDSRVVYLGHIPHGFFEKEMLGFFSQFGKVRKLKLFRNEKTNRSRGYAFIKFESSEIARVVAEAMDGYFLHDKQLVCNVVPITKLHDGMFKLTKTKLASVRKVDANNESESEEEEDLLAAGRESKAEEYSEEQLKNKVSAEKKSQRRKQKRLDELGIAYAIKLV